MDASQPTELGESTGPAESPRPAHWRQPGMSYKFQRLREKLRAAISSGELEGKLPGERALAKRFHVNAKTLSKALTDLAAEGVLDRSIGRGTFVKGAAPASASEGRWLTVCDPEDAASEVVAALRQANADLHVATSVREMRPSFLSQFDAVVDMASATAEPFLRDLVVRNMPLVAVNREPRTYSTHSVLLDVTLGVARLGRALILSGHRRLAAVEPRGHSEVSSALRQAIDRYASEATVDACVPDEIGSLIESGVTGIVCGSCRHAEQVKKKLEQSGIRIPAQVSLSAVGCIGTDAPCSGYYSTPGQIADAVVGLLRGTPSGRPATLWLAGTWHDLGTMAAIVAGPPGGESARVRMGEGMLV